MEISKICLCNSLTKCFAAVILTFFSIAIYAQEMPVSGVIVSEQGELLPGVTVLVRGTSTGTITDLDGNFRLNADKDAILEISFVGFKSENIIVNGQTNINITLKEDVLQMEEVVVIGYGSVDKKDLTGSVSVLGAEDLALQPVVRVEAALQSKIPGVLVNQNSGNPGSGLKVRIRGVNSFGASNGPLYVIDGFIGADVQSINPADIQTISVLKDASAAALYGSRGANGVIIITTKQGKSDDAQINVSYQRGLSQLRNRWDLMEGWQYMETINDKMRAGGTPEANLLFTRKDILLAQSNGTGTDWQDVVFQDGGQDQVQISMNKGGFYMSTAAQWNEGIVTGTKYNRYNLRLNYTEDIFDPVKLFIGVSNALEQKENSNDQEHIDIIRAAVGWPTHLSVFDTLSGDYTRNQAYGPLSVNPAYSIHETPNKVYRNDFLANTFLEFRLMEGLKFKTQGAINFKGISQTSFTRVSPNLVASSPLSSSYGNTNTMQLNWQMTQQLTYKKQIGQNDLDATVVYEAISNFERDFSGGGSELTTTDLGYYSSRVADTQTNSSDKSNLEIWSLLGRVNYTFRDKYLFTFNARHDESSRLAVGYEGATFYGGALAYRMSEEPFLQNIGAIEELKLRLSIGQLGSQAVGFTETVESVSYNKGYSFDGSQFDRGTGLPGPKNNRLSWETTNQVDGGFDLSLLQSRYNITFDVFYKRTTDLIFDQQVPAYAGGGKIAVNSGKMENKGLEFMVSGYAVDNRDFSVELNANVSVVRNKLLAIAGASDFIASGKNTQSDPDLLDNTHRNFVGKPLGLLWGLVYDGVYGTDEADIAALYNRSPGDAKYADLNGDTLIDNSDMAIIGNPYPDFVWGFTTNLKYKNFTLNLVWNGVHGVDVLNSLKASTYGGAGQRDATNADIVNRWTPENQGSDIPGFTTTSVLYRQSSQWIENGSYVKLRNATLKYDVPVRTIPWIKGINSLSLFITAQNALVFTKYTGYDPESLSNTGDRAGGFDEGGYPIPRTFLTGVNFKF
ncbi:TonB-dependent receptor [Marinoscillum sp. MHG1-6]|uniref:SusC/RagA family TonB-linked outer membrane protein n=1 Tax=Marinoscillum sp. MHG1-6 TaxID=2959627 RepID=UPI002157195E|nr:TonB-dependent receptor [Marinoscillum sp. MHG1-6]